MKRLPDATFDSVVTDPPYEIGYMNKGWDDVGVAFSVELWAQVLRMLKPGGHLLAFGATRTYHRMTCAIEDAGFEIRDSLHWFYGTGFPKSLNFKIHAEDCPARHSASVDCVVGFECPTVGTALKPAHEPVVLARKSVEGKIEANVAKHGTGALNIDACAIGERWPANVLLDQAAADELDGQTPHLRKGGNLKGGEGRNRNIISPLDLGPREPWSAYGDSGGASRFFFQTRRTLCRSCAYVKAAVERLSQNGGDVGSAENRVLESTTTFLQSPLDGALFDSREVSTNETLRESERKNGIGIEPIQSSGERFEPESQSARFSDSKNTHVKSAGLRTPTNIMTITDDPLKCDGCAARVTSESMFWSTGVGAADLERFKYVAKPGRSERDLGCSHLAVKSAGEATDRDDGTAGLKSPRAGAGRTGGARNYHPTVKPIELMRYLCRLITPPGGVVLDPFLGSGTTGIGALQEGFKFVGIEKEEEYLNIAYARISAGQEAE